MSPKNPLEGGKAAASLVGAAGIFSGGGGKSANMDGMGGRGGAVTGVDGDKSGEHGGNGGG